MWKQNWVDLSTPCVVLIFARSPPARQGKDEQRLRYEVNPPLSAKKNKTKQGDVDIIGIFLLYLHLNVIVLYYDST